NLEHRLQYLDDKQTQELPTGADDQALIAAAMGSVDYAELRVQLDAHRARVSQCFDDIFAASRPAAHPLAGLWQDGDPARQLETLRAAGFQEPEQALVRITEMRTSSRLRQMSAASHARMGRLAPLVIEAAARCSNPDATLSRLITVLESISR